VFGPGRIQVFSGGVFLLSYSECDEEQGEGGVGQEPFDDVFGVRGGGVEGAASGGGAGAGGDGEVGLGVGGDEVVCEVGGVEA